MFRFRLSKQWYTVHVGGDGPHSHDFKERAKSFLLTFFKGLFKKPLWRCGKDREEIGPRRLVVKVKDAWDDIKQKVYTLKEKDWIHRLHKKKRAALVEQLNQVSNDLFWLPQRQHFVKWLWTVGRLAIKKVLLLACNLFVWGGCRSEDGSDRSKAPRDLYPDSSFGKRSSTSNREVPLFILIGLIKEIWSLP